MTLLKQLYDRLAKSRDYKKLQSYEEAIDYILKLEKELVRKQEKKDAKNRKTDNPL